MYERMVMEKQDFCPIRQKWVQENCIQKGQLPLSYLTTSKIKRVVSLQVAVQGDQHYFIVFIRDKIDYWCEVSCKGSALL